MDALYQAREGGLPRDAVSWALQRALVEHLAAIWNQPDEGIWEVRNGRHQFTHSKVMAWVAPDPAIKTVDAHDWPGDVSRWRVPRAPSMPPSALMVSTMRAIASCRCMSATAWMRCLLLLLVVGFVDGKDPRMLGTIKAIEEEFLVNGLVRGYAQPSAADRLPGGEGIFLARSFWLADAYALSGGWAQAGELMERLLLLSNDVGLRAEEYLRVIRPIMCWEFSPGTVAHRSG